MADTYQVTPATIAGELPGLFPNGFTQVTKPNVQQVTDFISVADLMVSIAVENASAEPPDASDRLAALARRIVIDKVKAMVLRVVYAALAPADIDSATKPYEDLAQGALASIIALGAQAAGAGEPVNKVRTSTPGDLVRDLVVQDVDLNPGPAGHGSGYWGGRRQGQF
jgi:hypothetical protein